MPVDLVTLGLFVFLILPWTAPLLKSLELPGGWKIEFQTAAAAVEKIANNNPEPVKKEAEVEAAPVVQQEDPQLALVALRIEIEKRLRLLAKRNGVFDGQPLSHILRLLAKRGVLNSDRGKGLRELIDLGNQAAHGVPVDLSSSYGWNSQAPNLAAETFP